MLIDITKDQLEKFNYRIARKGNTLEVKQAFALKTVIDFKDSGKIEISHRLESWNFLTGTLPFSLKNALIYNWVGLILAMFLFLYIDMQGTGINVLVFFIGLTGWVLLWAMFYLIKAESLKRLIIDLNKE